MPMNNEMVFNAEKSSTGGAAHVEHAISSGSSSRSREHVPLYDGDKVNLIPMPTSDPKGRIKIFPVKKFEY